MKQTLKKIGVPALIVLCALGISVWQVGHQARAAVTYSWDPTFQEYWDVGFGCSSKTTCSTSCNSSTVGSTCVSDACTPYNTYVCDPWWSSNCGNSLHTEWQCTAHGMCTPDSSCAASTYDDSTCTDSCGNVYVGTKQHLCSDTGQQGTYPYCFTPTGCSATNACGDSNSGTTIDYAGTCSVGAPALPGGYGNACQSAANSCGMKNSGTIDCSASCNATVPSNSLCLGPDLTVTQNNTPVLAVVGVPVTFGGRVDNIGGAPASPAFTSYFIVDGATNVWTGSAITIPANSNAAVTAGSSYTFTTAGNHTTQLCADGAGVVNEGANEGNNCGPVTTVVVAPAGGTPDLTVTQNNTPTTATVGVPVTLSGRVDNVGTGPATPAFTSYFIVDGVTNVWTSPGITLAAGTNAAVTAGSSYTFTTAGNHTTQLCADGAGVVNEGANEGNNCGPVTTVVVAPAGGPSVSCTPSSQSVALGGTASWTANPGGAATAPYKWYDSFGTLLSSGASFSKVMNTAGTYAFHVTASDGGAGTVTSSDCQVTVAGGVCNDSGPVKLTASATRVKYNTPVTLSWTGSNVSAACTITGPGVNTSTSPAACTISGSIGTPNLITQSIYVLTCPGGQTSQVIINVIPKIQET